MQYIYLWDNALFSPRRLTRMSFVSSNAKFTNGQWLTPSIYSSFNGETFKTEASTKFLHQNVMALGSYRNSPFVTGHGSSTNGFKTEILNYKSGNWEEGTEYPFSNGNRYVSNNFLEGKNLHELMIMKNIWSFFKNIKLCNCFNSWKCFDHWRLYGWFTKLHINNRWI